MPRSLIGLLIVVSLAVAGFAAFASEPQAAAQSGVDVAGLDASPVAAVFAAPLQAPATTVAPVPVPAPEADKPEAAPAPAARSVVASGQASRPSVTTTTTTTTTVPPTTTTTTTVPPSTTTTTTTAPVTTTTTTVPAGSSTFPEAVEQWRGLVAAHFAPARVDEALAIIECESRGDPNATNPTSGAAGLFQFIPSTWDWVAGETGLDSYASGAPYDPTANTIAAAWLVQRSIDTDYSKGPWGHWTCRRVLS